MNACVSLNHKSPSTYIGITAMTMFLNASVILSKTQLDLLSLLEDLLLKYRNIQYQFEALE